MTAILYSKCSIVSSSTLKYYSVSSSILPVSNFHKICPISYAINIESWNLSLKGGVSSK